MNQAIADYHGPTTQPERTDGPILSKADLHRAILYVAANGMPAYHHLRRRLDITDSSLWSDPQSRCE